MTQSTILERVARIAVDQILPRIDSRLENSRRPFDRMDLFRPHTNSRLWGWTHFGVFIPDLPAPWRFLNTMTLIGATGATCFDNDHLAAADARNTATVFSSTARGDQHHYAAYDTSTECTFAADGSRLEWGEDLTLDIALPVVRVHGAYDEFSVDLTLEVTAASSYFIRNAIYDHVSLLAPYEGTLNDADGKHRISGLGTFEYARCITPQSLSKRALKPSRKLPVDFFTYQIIDLDADHQLLLTEVTAAGATACRLAHLRRRNGTAQVFTDVTFEVTSYAEDLVDPAGRRMRRPRELHWTVREDGGNLITLTGTTDAPWRFGHGRGYSTAYSYTGTWSGRGISGSAYMEWVDCRLL